LSGAAPISYWNSGVGVGQMGGRGSFNGARIGLTLCGEQLHDRHLKLTLKPEQKKDLVEFLKSL
jgi:hypothetical protein